MPKRIPTPPPGDDEPKYLSVVHPYAREGYCNMELQQDRKDFAFWVACCIDKDAFFAIFHKPSARDMVVIEVNRDYPHFDRILGEHRWSEFLRKPSEEEKGRATQVFYCTYSTGRIVEKNGWKRIFVEDSWFSGWSPKNSIIAYPYPAPHFCDVPVEDATNHPLCRPLPGLARPAPSEVIAAPKPVVGSAAWANSKEVPAIRTAPAWNTIAAKGSTKQQGVPKPAVPPTNSNTRKPTNTPLGNSQAKAPAVGGGPFVVKASNVWRADVGQGANPSKVVPVNWECSPGSSRQGTPEQRQSAASSSSTSVNQPPPSLPPKANDWNAGPPPGVVVSDHRGKTTKSVSTPSGSPFVPDRTTNASCSSTGSSPSVSTPDTESGCNDVCEDPHMVHIQISDSFEEEFHGIGIKERGVTSDDDEYLAELDAVAPGSWATTTDTWGSLDPSTGTWDDVAGSQQEAQKKEVCSVHGVICKKGICKEYGKKQAAAKRMQKAEEAAKQKQEKTGKKGKAPAGNGARGRGGGPTASNNTQNNPYRGAGAPVKKNWRGAPRAIVSPDALEQREAATQPVENVNGWGDNEDDAADGSDEPTTQNTETASDVASNDGWNISEASYDPWATKKKGMSWAEEVEAASAAGSDGGGRRSGVRAGRGRGGRRGRR